jgi:hypothetical protein
VVALAARVEIIGVIMASVQDATGRAGATGSETMTTAAQPSAAASTHVGTPDYAAGMTDADRASGPRSFLVGLILTSVAIATLVMVSFIWYRWHGVQEPTTAIIIDGDATLDGTTISVRGGPRSVTTSLKKSNSYSAVLLVDPGRYWVTATRDNELLLRKEVEVKRFLGVRFNLVEFLKAQKLAAESGRTLLLPGETPGSALGGTP